MCVSWEPRARGAGADIPAACAVGLQSRSAWLRRQVDPFSLVNHRGQEEGGARGGDAAFTNVRGRWT